MDDVQPIAAPTPKVRRYHSPGFRAEVIKAVRQPGISLAAVARSFDLSPNLVRRWVRKSDDGQRRSAHASAARLAAIRAQLGGQSVAASATNSAGSRALSGFIPLALKSPSSPATIPSTDIRIEVTRGSTSVTLAWPVSAAEHCGAWLCELLR